MRLEDQGEVGGQSLHQPTLLSTTACPGHSTLPLPHKPTQQTPRLVKRRPSLTEVVSLTQHHKRRMCWGQDSNGGCQEPNPQLQLLLYNTAADEERGPRTRKAGRCQKEVTEGTGWVRAQAVLWVPEGPPSGSGREVRGQPEYVNFLRP